jgi:GLPGLI family protein
MRKLFLLALILGSWLNHTIGQSFQATLKFEEKTNLHKTVGKSNPDLMQYLPEYRVSQKILAIKDKMSVYVNGEDQENISINRGGGPMSFSFKVPEEILFKDLENGEVVEEKDFMGKKFLIEGEKKVMAWKITGNMKSILGYPCMEAVYSDTSQNMIAYFAPGLPLSGGPQIYGGLPGLILELDINEGERIFVATSIQLEEPTVSIQKPVKGKKMNRDEFDQMVKERMEEMQATGGGGGMRIMMGSFRN